MHICVDLDLELRRLYCLRILVALELKSYGQGGEKVHIFPLVLHSMFLTILENALEWQQTQCKALY